MPAIAVCITLLSACGSASSTGASTNGGSSVAGLATPTTAAKAAKTPAADERPLIRPDTSQAEQDRLTRVYLSCLKANGFPRSMLKGTRANGSPEGTTEAKYTKQCGSKKPMGESDKAFLSDPDYADHLRAEASCLNQHGIRSQIRNGQISWLDGLPPEDKGHWVDDCEQQAFAVYYKTLN